MPGARSTAIVFAAAPVAATPRLRRRLRGLPISMVVAADGGAANAFAFGYQPDVVVGDLDSIEPTTLAELQRRQVPIEAHPRDKNATDGQLAIERALEAEPTDLVLLGFLGGPRLDQALAHVLLLTRLAPPAVMLDERNECQLVRSNGEQVWQTEPGEVVSLVPMSADVTGVRTRGLRWPLVDERLVLGETRTISNEVIAAEAGISLRSGHLLVTRHFAVP